MSTQEQIIFVSEMLLKSTHSVAFTGAGISAESGIPVFRGKDGLWEKYNPKALDLEYFYAKPKASWEVIKDVFYKFLINIKPNAAHYSLAEWERMNVLHAIITQNIDNLHQKAGNKNVFEFHGSAARLICTSCLKQYTALEISLEVLPPLCVKCKGLLKPDFIFFGEPITEEAYQSSMKALQNCQLMLIIGTSGEVSPANSLPYLAKENGALIVEINKDKSLYSNSLSDIIINGNATEILQNISMHLLAHNKAVK